MAAPDSLAAWHRPHVNGLVAMVFELPSPGRFAAGAAPVNATASLSQISGTVDGAKAFADNAAKCAAGCSCPAWTR